MIFIYRNELCIHTQKEERFCEVTKTLDANIDLKIIFVGP